MTIAEHISFTQLNMFLRCGEQYRRRYIEGQIIPPSAVLVRGRCCHAAEAINYSQKITSTEDLPTEEVVDLFSDGWEQDKYQIAFTDEELDGDSPTKAMGKWKDTGIGLIRVYHDELAPLAKPTHVEYEFLVKFDGTYHPPLLGYMDRIDTDVVVETKFQSKSPPAGDINKDVQLTCYDLAHRTTFGKKPKRLRKEYGIATKTPKTSFQESLPREDEQIDRFLWRVQTFLEALQKGIFLPAANDAWCCAPKWCGYYHTCKYRQ